MEASNNTSLENSSVASTDVIPQAANNHRYAADWYESYHFGGEYHGTYNRNFIATHDIFALAEAPDDTYIIVTGDGHYYID